jgi:hypothetical protein
MRTHGVVLCNQARALDLAARKARFVEKAPDFIVDVMKQTCPSARASDPAAVPVLALVKCGLPDPNARLSAEDIEWLDAAPVGREAI